MLLENDLSLTSGNASLSPEVYDNNVCYISYPSYKEIYYNNEGYISDKWENYFDVYDSAYKKFINKNPDVLEIGVQNGGSLENAKKYFINGNIYGVDINPAVCKLEFSKNITTFCFDASDKREFEKYLEGIFFDIILDDASHICSEVINTFKNLFPKIKPGGVYVIEDLHTSYWSAYGGGLQEKNSSIEFLKKIIDLLNAYHITDSFINILNDYESYMVKWVESITFYDGIAYIKKLEEPRNNKYKRVMHGKYANIVKLPKP